MTGTTFVRSAGKLISTGDLRGYSQPPPFLQEARARRIEAVPPLLGFRPTPFEKYDIPVNTSNFDINIEERVCRPKCSFMQLDWEASSTTETASIHPSQQVYLSLCNSYFYIQSFLFFAFLCLHTYDVYPCSFFSCPSVPDRAPVILTLKTLHQ